MGPIAKMGIPGGPGVANAGWQESGRPRPPKRARRAPYLFVEHQVRIDLLVPPTRVINAMTATAAQRKSEMTTYTIDNENNITAHGSQQEAGEGEAFGSQLELADLAATWEANRLIEVWNGIPGLTPVKKFTNRKSAVARIWKAIQSLDGGNAAETSDPTKASATAVSKRATKAKHAAKQAKKTKGSTSSAKAPTKAFKGKLGKAASKPAAARDGSKKPEVLGMLQRKGGATLGGANKCIWCGATANGNGCPNNPANNHVK